MGSKRSSKHISSNSNWTADNLATFLRAGVLISEQMRALEESDDDDDDELTRTVLVFVRLCALIIEIDLIPF